MMMMLMAVVVPISFSYPEDLIKIMDVKSAWHGVSTLYILN